MQEIKMDKNVSVTIKTIMENNGITPEILAELFWDMNDKEQTKFFNHVGRLANSSELWIQFSYLDCDTYGITVLETLHSATN
jgi:hypothetical protein